MKGVIRRTLTAALFLVSCLPWLATDSMGRSAGADEFEFFREQVEPLLQRRCYGCHSHAADEMEGGLALDWRCGWEQGGDRGPAIVPGDPDGSLLIRAVRHTDPDLAMPEDRLPDAEIDVLTRWVQRGAPDPRTLPPRQDGAEIAADWWSLRPLVRPAVPVSQVAHPIDAFIQDRLAREGLRPSPVADRRTLIRRLMVDLHGLLPTPEETEAFVGDASPTAVKDLVERLLASPRYGERWARHWLDTIHFADSHGYEHDVFRPHAWRYRDYVIARFNQDTPWPRFIREQIAADVFYADDPTLTPALGFLGAGTYDHSAATTAPKSFENLDRDDLVTQTMAAFVSTTANCARCHAHKFDPITQEDYYALQAVFAGIGKGNVAFDADRGVASQRQHWQALQKACEQFDSDLLLTEESQRLVAAWEQERGGDVPWRPLEIETFVSVDATPLKRLDDGSILSTGPVPDKETTAVTAVTTLPRITAVRLDILPDDSLPQRGPGRAENGNLHLSEMEIRVFRPGAIAGERLAIRDATADFEQEGWTIRHALDGDLGTAWGIHPEEGKPHYAVFELETPLAVEPGTRLHLLMRQVHGRSHVIGRFGLSVTDAPAERTVALPWAAQVIRALPVDERSRAQQTMLSAFILRRIAEAELRQLPAQQMVYAAASVAENERGIVRIDPPREIHVLRRGDVEQPGALVQPGALTMIRALPARFALPAGHPESARRAALADWLASPENPLTWRSIANRVWHYHFGRGLCDTPSDFGRMGGVPTHPELLDFLACELRDHGGSLKSLHRLICTSDTWQQSSACTVELAALDPESRLLARMSRQRLDADSYRDAVLAASGRLDLTMGGPGIPHFTSRPGAQLTPILDYRSFDWDSPGATRRSIYRVVWRGIPDPLFELLDFPDLGLLAPTRSFSASPLQSLALLNNTFVLHHARHMAQRAAAVADQLTAQVRQLVAWTWQRAPTDDEATRLEALARRHGLESVCRLLLNTNEFLFVD